MSSNSRNANNNGQQERSQQPPAYPQQQQQHQRQPTPPHSPIIGQPPVTPYPLDLDMAQERIKDRRLAITGPDAVSPPDYSDPHPPTHHWNSEANRPGSPDLRARQRALSSQSQEPQSSSPYSQWIPEQLLGSSTRSTRAPNPQSPLISAAGSVVNYSAINNSGRSTLLNSRSPSVLHESPSYQSEPGPRRFSRPRSCPRCSRIGIRWGLYCPICRMPLRRRPIQGMVKGDDKGDGKEDGKKDGTNDGKKDGRGNRAPTAA
ncbi:hypothetical protein QBC41DRAFT_312596 [Cercophora samala]|uniref:Uncharacterized protein n=1 Tax=Cercophora samala TaxID=330535 RepID=A0AA40DFE5_9PEZI|nr:hypothetical protein QBC41DRAFT_312596 [Cercophora samala]